MAAAVARVALTGRRMLACTGAARCTSAVGLLRVALSTSAPLRAPKAKGKAAAPAAAPAASSHDDSAGDIESEVAAASTPKDLKSQMHKHVEYAKRELGKLRGSTASPNMLDHVQVEAYGERQPLTGLAQIALKGPALLVVNPFDSALAEAIAEAIRDADLNLNPQTEGSVVRVPVPKASKETKEATVKLISKIAEASKTRVRRVRQAAMDKLKKAEGVSKDDVFRDMKDIDALSAGATEEIAKLAEKKKLEVEAA